MYVMIMVLIIPYCRGPPSGTKRSVACGAASSRSPEGGDGAVGKPRRAETSRFELFEIMILAKLGKQFSVERFEATVSQSAAPSPSQECLADLRQGLAERGSRLFVFEAPSWRFGEDSLRESYDVVFR